jgi:hypothetical protein
VKRLYEDLGIAQNLLQGDDAQSSGRTLFKQMLLSNVEYAYGAHMVLV